MPRVRDLIAHILHHVNAEDATRDSSQVAGVARRAQYVRDAVNSLKTDSRDLRIDALLAEMIAVATVSPVDRTDYCAACPAERTLSHQKPWLAIHGWAGFLRSRPVRNG